MNAVFSSEIKPSEIEKYAFAKNSFAWGEYRKIRDKKQILETFGEQIREWSQASASVVAHWKEEEKREKEEQFDRVFDVFMIYKQAVDQVERILNGLKDAVQSASPPPFSDQHWQALTKLGVKTLKIKERWERDFELAPALLQEKINELEPYYLTVSSQLKNAKLALEPWATKVKEKYPKSALWQFSATTAKYLTGVTTYMDKLIQAYPKTDEQK